MSDIIWMLKFLHIFKRMSWFAVYLIFVIVLTIVATAVLYGMGVFKNSNIGFVYLLFLLYDMLVLALAFLMTPFFDKARVHILSSCLSLHFRTNLLYFCYFYRRWLESLAQWLLAFWIYFITSKLRLEMRHLNTSTGFSL